MTIVKIIRTENDSPKHISFIFTNSLYNSKEFGSSWPIVIVTHKHMLFPGSMYLGQCPREHYILFPGSMYLGQCPREHYIPIYLIVAGVFGILKNLSNVTQRVKNRLEDEDETETVAKTNPFDATLNCFLMAWFIAGWFMRTGVSDCNGADWGYKRNIMNMYLV